MTQIDLPLLQRWLTGWSLSRGLPLPVREGGGLRVEVGMPLQLRRHVFVDAGAALQLCAAQIHAPHIYLKAAVEPAVLRAALPPRWVLEAPGYLMQGPSAFSATAELPPGYRLALSDEHGAQLVRVLAPDGGIAAAGRIVTHDGCAIFDQIITAEAHRRRGLATVVMHQLNGLAIEARATERLLVATQAGRDLYVRLGWQLLGTWSTAVLPAS